MGCGGSKQTAVEDESRGNNAQQTSGEDAQNNNNNTSATSPEKAPTKPPPQPAKQSPSKTKTDTPREKYVVNGSVNGTSARSDSVFSESNDRGIKRRVREKLIEATSGSSIEELDKAMDRFTRNKLDDCGDYTKATDRMEFLKLRRDLRDAVWRSHVGVLEKTINEAENSRFSGQLRHQIDAARRKLQHLKELNEYKHDILTMEQSTISEIHSYQRPPACVHDVMAATYMMLGHPENRLTEWSDIQMLLCRVGRDSLMHEVRDFDSSSVHQTTNQRVQDILHPHQLHTIRQASNGAATFYVWTTQICEKVDRDQAQEEERLRQEELQQQQQQQQQQQEQTDGRQSDSQQSQGARTKKG